MPPSRIISRSSSMPSQAGRLSCSFSSWMDPLTTGSASNSPFSHGSSRGDVRESMTACGAHHHHHLSTHHRHSPPATTTHHRSSTLKGFLPPASSCHGPVTYSEAATAAHRTGRRAMLSNYPSPPARPAAQNREKDTMRIPFPETQARETCGANGTRPGGMERERDDPDSFEAKTDTCEGREEVGETEKGETRDRSEGRRERMRSKKGERAGVRMRKHEARMTETRRHRRESTRGWTATPGGGSALCHTRRSESSRYHLRLSFVQELGCF